MVGRKRDFRYKLLLLLRRKGKDVVFVCRPVPLPWRRMGLPIFCIVLATHERTE